MYRAMRRTGMYFHSEASRSLPCKVREPHITRPAAGMALRQLIPSGFSSPFSGSVKGTLNCGTCTGGQVCGGSGPNICGPADCEPKTCAQLGASCGFVSDGCSTAINCGSCVSPEQCGGGGVGIEMGGGGAKPEGKRELATQGGRSRRPRRGPAYEREGVVRPPEPQFQG